MHSVSEVCLSEKVYDKGTAYHCGIIDREEKERNPYPPVSINDPLCYLWFAENNLLETNNVWAAERVSEPATSTLPTSSAAKAWLALA